MRQTLFYIPHEIFGLPLFGIGVLFALWLAASLALMFFEVRRKGWNAETIGYLPVLLLIGAAIAFVVPAIAGDRGVPIRGFGMMLLLAVCAAYGLAAYRAPRMGLDPEILPTMAMWCLPPGFIGARLYYVIEKWDQFQRPGLKATLAELVNVTKGGLVVYGAIMGGFVGFVLFVRRYRLPARLLCDLAAPSVMLGLALGRLGCFMNGCCYGGYCQGPMGVQFPWRSPPHLHQVETGQVYLHGIRLAADRYRAPVVDSVEPGSPAARQGVKKGERITAIYDPQLNKRLPVKTIDDAYALLFDLYGEGEGRLGFWDWLLRRQTALTETFEHPITVEIATISSTGARPSLPQGPLLPQGHVRRWTLTGPPPQSKPVYPTQLFSSIDALLICLFLLAQHPYRRWDGETTAWLGTIYPVSRLLMEFVRDDEPAALWGLKTSQLISLSILAVTIVFWLYLLYQPRLRENGLSVHEPGAV